MSGSIIRLRNGPCMQGARNAESLSEILDALLVASSQLSGLDVFKKCDLFIDVGPANRPEAVNIDVTVEEQVRRC